jgi:hypothetical protein
METQIPSTAKVAGGMLLRSSLERLIAARRRSQLVSVFDRIEIDACALTYVSSFLLNNSVLQGDDAQPELFVKITARELSIYAVVWDEDAISSFKLL